MSKYLDKLVTCRQFGLGISGNRLLLSPEKNDLSPSPSPFQKLDYKSKSKSEKWKWLKSKSKSDFKSSKTIEFQILGTR